MLKVLGGFFYSYFDTVFNFLLTVIDYDSLEIIAAQAGENPVIGYALIMYFSVAFVMMTTVIALQSLYRLVNFLYRKEMAWRRYKKLKTLHPVMAARVVKVH